VTPDFWIPGQARNDMKNPKSDEFATLSYPDVKIIILWGREKP
jgi:hypothetical protein